MRLPGSGGAPEIATHAKRTLVINRLDLQAFPADVDFVTSPGHSYHGLRRDTFGLPGAGPVRVITDRGILDADAETGELVLTALYPGNDLDDVRSRVGWSLRVREPVDVVEPPSADVLRVLRESFSEGGLGAPRPQLGTAESRE